MLALSLEQPGWAGKLPAGVKLLALMGTTVLLYPVQSPIILGLVLLGVAALYGSLGQRAFKSGLVMLRPLLVICLVIAFYHLVIGAFERGAVFVLKLLAMVGIANFVTMTTRLSEMMDVVMRLLRPLQRLGINTRAIALAFTLVIRFTPVLILKGRALTEAWRARSTARAGWRIVIPLVLLALDDADNVAEALRARGGVQNE